MNRKIKNTLISFGIPLAYALLIRIIFDIEIEGWDELFGVMTITFLFLLPTIIGALVVCFSSYKRVKKITYRIFAPWIPVFLFLAVTLLLSIEGWACWLMILPVFLIASSIGGLFGGYLVLQRKNKRLKISLLFLLPFLVGPVESLVETIPGKYEAYTSIVIDAPAEKIWDNVTHVHTIPKKMDKGYLSQLLGFPRPVKAELNYEGVGAYRKAIFTGGLEFHETVTQYKDEKKMVFKIQAYPQEIPSTTLDEHVTVGGNYFDVLKGIYKLEKLPKGKYKLHLYSYFKLNTTFDFYAGLWARWIMKDIQSNILQVQKKRAES